MKKFLHRHPQLISFTIIVIVVLVGFAIQQDNINELNSLNSKIAIFAPVSNDVVKITNKVEGVPGAALHLDENINIEVKLCNTLDYVVKGSASLNWQAMDMSGNPIIGQNVTAYAAAYGERAPGCETKTISFIMPGNVGRIEESLINAGTPHLWKLYGGFIPIAPDGTFGVKAPFISPTFTIVP